MLVLARGAGHAVLTSHPSLVKAPQDLFIDFLAWRNKSLPRWMVHLCVWVVLVWKGHLCLSQVRVKWPRLVRDLDSIMV